LKSVPPLEPMQQKRYFVRLKTRQPARIRLTEAQAPHCEILDFCPTGFYLKLADPNAVALAGTALSQQQAVVVVEFSRGQEGDGEYFQVQGRISHCSAGGVGIFAEAMPTAAFRALLLYRARLYQKELPSGAAKLDPVDAQTIKNQCLSLYRPFLVQVGRKFFQLAEARGREIEEHQVAVELSERTSYLAGLTEITQQRQRIEHKFGKAALARVDGNTACKIPAPVDPTTSELSLVQEDEFEDWLNLAAVIDQLENALKRSLGYFENLYAAITGNTPELDLETGYFHSAIGQASPFSPDALCRSLQEALQGLELDIAQRARLYRLFGQALTLHGEAFYESLSILAAVIESRARGTDASRPAAPSLRSNRPRSDQAPGVGTDHAQPASSEPTMAPGPQTDTPAAAPAESGLIQTTSLLRQMVSQLIPLLPRHTPALPATPAPPPNQSLPTVDSGELLQALQEVIQTRQGTRVVDGQASAATQLHARLGQESGGTAVHISPQQLQVLDSLGGLFDRARQEYAAESELELLIRRFELPFYKLALNDANFLIEEQHPARQTINLLDQFAIATDDHGKFFDSRLRNSLDALLSEAISKAEQDTNIYRHTAQILDKMLHPLRNEHKQRVLRLQEASEGKYHILSSRARVLFALESRLGGREIPKILLRLLHTGWQHYLSLLALRQGTQGEEWEAAIGAVEHLLAWLDPDCPPESDHHERITELLRRLQRGLATVCLAPDDCSALLTELSELLLSEHLDRPAPEWVKVAPGWLLRGIEDMAPDFHRNNPLLEQLAPGCWWNIAAEDGTPHPMQLIWQSQPPGFCTFANRSAKKKLELTLADLAERQVAGRATEAPDMALPLLARSESAMVNTIFRQLAHQATHDPVTDLRNRRALLHYLAKLAARASGRDQPQTLWVITFDQLQKIVQQFGPQAREALLRQLATELRQALHPDDELAALDENSFAVCLPACDAAEGQRRAETLLASLQQYRFRHGADSISVGAGIGMVAFRPGCLEGEELLRRAEAVSRQALASGPYQFQLYAADTAAVQQMEPPVPPAEPIERLQDRKGLFLRCQRIKPVRPLAGQKSYYEILLGVRAPDGSEVGPLGFIRAVERANRTHDIDRWVLDKVCHWMLAHPELLDSIAGLTINLSPRSLDNEGVLDFLHHLLATPRFPAGKLVFELTEPDTINSTVITGTFIQQFRRYGCQFCIDDFGSGYASYGNLKSLHATAFKIDGNLIKDMLRLPTAYAMVQSTTEIGHSLGMRVIAEQVETAALLDAVQEIGVDYVQGNADHHPMPLEELLAAPR